jgi:hypothetical protein
MSHAFRVSVFSIKKSDGRVTPDAEFDHLYSRFTQHRRAVIDLAQQIDNWVDTFRKIQVQSLALSSTVNNYFHQPTSSSEPRYGALVKTSLEKFSQALVHQVDKTKVSAVNDILAYVDQLDTVEGLVRRRNTSFKEYDYYMVKVQRMKSDPPKDPAKLPRNELKLLDAEEAYRSQNAELIGILTTLMADVPHNAQGSLLSIIESLQLLKTNLTEMGAPWVIADRSPEEYDIRVDFKRRDLGAMATRRTSSASVVAYPPPYNAARAPVTQITSPQLKVKGDDSPTSTPIATATPTSTAQPLIKDAPKFRVVGTFTFTAEEDDELSFVEGEELTIIDQMGDGQWWVARNAAGKQGMIPHNYVRMLD